MNIQNENALVTLAPMLYKECSMDSTKTCMAFGFECNDGWFELIKKLSSDLEFLNKVIGQPNKLCIVAKQVKEKFGTLRFYLDVEDQDPENTDKDHLNARENLRNIAFKLARETEGESCSVCEDCGSLAGHETSVHGWMATLCKKCEEKRNAKTEAPV